MFGWGGFSTGSLFGGGTIQGNLTVTGNLTVQGSTTSVVNQTTTGTLGVTVGSATALTVAAAGTNYALQVDTSTASAVNGLKITSTAAGGGVTLGVISSNATEALTIASKGATNLTLNTLVISSTGIVTTGQWNASLIPLAYGGTNANLAASNGGIFYSTATGGAILAGTATANQALLSGTSAAPAWSTATYPAATTVNQLLYSSAANTIAGLATGNNGVLITSAGGVPSISSTLPTAVQGNITQVGTVTTGVWNGTTIAVANGGTGVTTFAANGVLYGNAATSVLATAQGVANSILTANAGAPSFSQAPTINTSLTIGVNASQTGTLLLANGGVAGASVTIQNNGATAGYNFNLPTGAGTSGQPLLSGGGAASAMTFGTLGAGAGGTGNTTNTLNGVLYGNGTGALQVTGQGAANSILTANAGAPSFSAAPTIGTSVTCPLLIGGTAVGSTLTLRSTSGIGSSDAIIFTVGNNGATESFRCLTSGNIQIADAINIVAGSTTGNQIATATTQKLGFYGAAPIVQRSGAAQAAVSTTASTQTSPFGYTTSAQADGIVTLVNELRAWAVAQGFIKGSA